MEYILLYSLREGIKRIYAINAAKLLRLEDEKNEADGDVNAGAACNVNNANIRKIPDELCDEILYTESYRSGDK
jgi:hypothetical protein